MESKSEEAPNDKSQPSIENTPELQQPNKAADNKEQQPKEQKSDESQPPAATTYRLFGARDVEWF